MLGAVEIGRGQSPQGFANGGRHPEQSLMRRERLPISKPRVITWGEPVSTGRRQGSPARRRV